MKSLLYLNKYFAKYKFKLLLGALFIVLSNAAQVYIPILLKESIDSLKNNISYRILLHYSLLIIITALLGGLFKFFIRITVIIVAREIEFDLRNDLWKHIQNLSTKFFLNNSTGTLMAHVTNDIRAVRMYLGPAVMFSVETVTKIIIVVVIMFSINIELTVYTLLPLPLLSFLVYKLSEKIHIKFEKIQERFSELTKKAQENFSGIRIIKSYVREQDEIKNFTKLSNEYLSANMEKVKIQALFVPMLFLITGVSLIIVVWFGGSMVIENKLTLGEVVAFVAYLSLLIWPVIAFGWVINIAQQASASMKRLLKIFNEKNEVENSKENNSAVKTINGEIEFKNVFFRYGKNYEHVLKNISFKIKQGETLAIVGHTGSGKTTLVNLIPRLYDVTEGEILIDGVNVKNINKEVLRENIGMVPQETFLFSDTLLNNIAYGLKETAVEVVERVAEISRLKKDVENFSYGFETLLGERGVTLSGGQKQRASLARALAVNPKILILDDSFSAVDTNTEEEILQKLKIFMKGRTSIIISHRISTVKYADNIIVLHNGKIVERGTHKELLNAKGIYAEMHEKQLLEKELEEL